MSLGSLEWGSTVRGPQEAALQRPRDRHAAAGAAAHDRRLGFVVLYSALGADTGLLLRQGLRFAFGLAAFFVSSQVPPRYLRMCTPWVFFLGVALLLAVAIEGDIAKGAQRWLDLGVVRFQPSEIMKLAVPMMCAWFLHERPLPPTFLQIVVMHAIVLVPALLIAEQPDLGTALLVIAAGGHGDPARGTAAALHPRRRSCCAVGRRAGALALHARLPAQRVLTFLDPQTRPARRGLSHHPVADRDRLGRPVRQGLDERHQAQLEFLPERSTDFIFAVIGEECGLLGLSAADRAVPARRRPRPVYRGAGAGHVHAAARRQPRADVLRLRVRERRHGRRGSLPVVGVPLPLVSYGGTSMVTLMAGFGILAAIHGHRKLSRHERRTETTTAR